MVDILGKGRGGLNKNQQTDVFQRLSPTLLPRVSKKTRVNPSLLREMWRAAASLELLPLQTKTQLGDELIARVSKGDFVDTGLWCLARLGARKLFYGPINHVLPPTTAARWIDALLNPQVSGRGRSPARRTGDSARDLPPHTLELVRRACPDLDLEPGSQENLASMGGSSARNSRRAWCSRNRNTCPRALFPRLRIPGRRSPNPANWVWSNN